MHCTEKYIVFTSKMDFVVPKCSSVTHIFKIHFIGKHLSSIFEIFKSFFLHYWTSRLMHFNRLELYNRNKYSKHFTPTIIGFIHISGLLTAYRFSKCDLITNSYLKKLKQQLSLRINTFDFCVNVNYILVIKYSSDVTNCSIFKLNPVQFEKRAHN